MGDTHVSSQEKTSSKHVDIYIYQANSRGLRHLLVLLDSDVPFSIGGRDEELDAYAPSGFIELSAKARRTNLRSAGLAVHRQMLMRTIFMLEE